MSDSTYYREQTCIPEAEQHVWQRGRCECGNNPLSRVLRALVLCEGITGRDADRAVEALRALSVRLRAEARG